VQRYHRESTIVSQVRTTSPIRTKGRPVGASTDRRPRRNTI